MKDKKILGEERRDFLLNLLKERREPITGGELSSKTNVSRQIIVQDISLLKARNEPIIATSQGYLYLSQGQEQLHQRVVACFHQPDQTAEELNLIVDNGVTVKDVIIEHPVYGDLTASIMVSNRKEVEQFLEKINKTNASYLSQLTDGTHLHTLEADSQGKLEAACKALSKAGYLIES
ncbi:transcription repressor NadR [Bacillus sp. PS06]|uniref:transcription repressor NadR n=1 Tax=Bacillus sp. PS06 TaxID=2764176 RepID=UPI001784AB20|nr:transcription repressor NadR [Bacillus sp. PS06]MBD8069338.1 transcription repressor NadR [Bacillus sp. PS06]